MGREPVIQVIDIGFIAMDRHAMSKLALRASQYLLIGTLFVSLGGHLALLQTVAWGNMLAGFSRTESFKEAAEKTFDGKHPCTMCKMVKESKRQDEHKPLVKADMKLDIVLPAPVLLMALSGVPVVMLPPVYLDRDSDVRMGIPLQPPRAI